MRFFMRFGKNILVILLSLSFFGFTGKEKYIDLDSAMNARTSAHFTQDSRNILFVLGQNTKAEILSFKKFNSGNYGLQVRVATGPHKNQVIWVYHNISHPTMALYEDCPTTWTTTGIKSCKSSTSAERANASVALTETPATRYEPAEVEAILPEVVVHGNAAAVDSDAVASCANCSLAANTSSPTSLPQDYVDELQETSTRNPLMGAYRVMADMYQSCHVLNLPTFDPVHDDFISRLIRKIPNRRSSHAKSRIIPRENLVKIGDQHYYLKDSPDTKNPACRDMKDTPPLYYYGGRPQIHNNVMSIFPVQQPTRNSAPSVGLDCSGFISSAFIVSGLKLTPQVRNASENVTTAAGLNSFSENNSCFNRPTFTENKTLEPGDVIATQNHTFMIDQVGADPFAIEKAKAKGSFPQSVAGCSRYQPPVNDLDFTIIQSGGVGSLPAVRIKAKDYSNGQKHFLNLAVQACRAQFTPTGSTRTGLHSRSPIMSLLRHKGDSDPRCMFNKDQIPRLAGEECTQGCFKESI